MFDLQTTLISQVLNQAIITIVMFSIWKDNKARVPGLNYWMLNLVLQTVVQLYRFAAIYPLSVDTVKKERHMVSKHLLFDGISLFYFFCNLSLPNY
ncbi:MAG: hypothetical protein HQ557_02655 [Bacteroidetes bacterium]|nr:hypothetical protein [Bacteroidota bacterium]